LKANVFVLPERGGALLVDKPVGPTSHDVVAWARKTLGTKRVGHTGTLDPFASGLLVLLFGPATRLAEYLSGHAKTYTATACLGVRTNTHDFQGRVLEQAGDAAPVEREKVEAELSRFEGLIRQVPPQYSAKKVDGEAMYRKARRGEVVEIEPVEVEVSEVRLTSYNAPSLNFDVTCSAGTYIRALARDLGENLGVGAHLTALRRTGVGDFSVDAALAGDALRAGVRPDPGQWISAEAAVRHFPTIRVSAEEVTLLCNGMRIPMPEGTAEPADPGTPVSLVDDAGLLGIAEVKEGQLAPKKILQSVVA
jgi:tRNA pseudouridine55 synthase